MPTPEPLGPPGRARLRERELMPRAADLRPIPRLALRWPEAAKALGLSESKFRQMVAAGDFRRPAVVGGVPLFDFGHLQEDWEALRRAP